MTCRCGYSHHGIECDCGRFTPPPPETTRARPSGAAHSAPGDAPATPAAQTAPDASTGVLRARSEMTTGEAEAWRAGWAACVAAAAARLRDIADSYAANDLPGAEQFRAAAAEVERMPVPPGRREPTGLEVRGG